MNNKSNGYGVASMTLGILSILFSWLPFISALALIAGVLAIIFAVMQKKAAPNSMATAGLVTGIIGLIFSTLWTILYLAAAVSGSASTYPMM